MVWIYNSPLTEKEQKAYDVLEQRFGDSELAKNTVKIVSLVGEVKSQKFSSPKDIETSFFFDSNRRVPIFNKTTAENLFKELKQHGGANSSYPFTDYSARQGLDKAANSLPEIVVAPIENIYRLLSTPLLRLKEKVPLADLAITAANGMAESGISAVGDVAKTLGGPMGSLIAIPIMAFAAAMASTSTLLQRDLGQTVVYMVTAIPFVGSIMVKAIDKVEKQISKLKKYPDLAYYVPFVRDYINEERAKKGLPPLQPFDPRAKLQAAVQANPYAQKAMAAANSAQQTANAIRETNPFQQPIVPQENPFKQPIVPQTNPFKAGKRFSTRRHTTNKKWLKTRRTKSAKA